MKTLKKFNCGPAFAYTEVRLILVNPEKDQNKVKNFFGRKTMTLPMGFVHYKRWAESRGKEPLYIVITNDPERSITNKIKTLGHEMSHVQGALANAFKVDPGAEPIAYTMSYMHGEFIPALIDSLGYEIKIKEKEGN